MGHQYAAGDKAMHQRSDPIRRGVVFIVFGCQKPMPGASVDAHVEAIRKTIDGKLLLHKKWQDQRGSHIAIFAMEKTADNSFGSRLNITS